MSAVALARDVQPGIQLRSQAAASGARKGLPESNCPGPRAARVVRFRSRAVERLPLARGYGRAAPPPFSGQGIGDGDYRLHPLRSAARRRCPLLFRAAIPGEEGVAVVPAGSAEAVSPDTQPCVPERREHRASAQSIRIEQAVPAGTRGPSLPKRSSPGAAETGQARPPWIRWRAASRNATSLPAASI